MATDVSRENEKDGMIMKNYSEDVNRQYHIQVAKGEVDNLVSLGVTVLLFTQCLVTIVTVHSVHSNVAKIHSRLPAAMEFWLACLGIVMCEQ